MNHPSLNNRLPRYSTNGETEFVMNPTTKARLALLIACVWPFLVLLMYEASVSSTSTFVGSQSQDEESSSSLRHLLDRMDIVTTGYGPTHPRYSMIVVGDNSTMMEETVESIFRHSDLNRLFMVCIAVKEDTNNNQDGGWSNQEKQKFTSTLESYEQGQNIPHWHGLQSHFHRTTDKEKNKNHLNNDNDKDSSDEDDDNDNDDDDDEEESNEESHSRHHHSKKIHVLWNSNDGMNAGRHDCASFIQILSTQYEMANLKSKHEDILLVLLQQGAVFQNTDWIQPTTKALIVSPPLLSNEDTAVSMKLANAISFLPTPSSSSLQRNNGNGDQSSTSQFLSLPRTTFNYNLERVTSQAKGQDLAQSNGMSYTTPIVDGLATAMRLETFLQLPSQDTTPITTQSSSSEVVDTLWYSNLELSMNLWLCGDGIDVFTNVNIGISSTKQKQLKEQQQQSQQQKLSIEQAARFVAAWIPPSSLYGDVMYQQFRHGRQKDQDKGSASTNNNNNNDDKNNHHHNIITRTEWDVLLASAKQIPTYSNGLQTKCRPFEWFVESIHSELPPPSIVLQELEKQQDLEKQQQMDANHAAAIDKKKDNDTPPKNNNNNNNKEAAAAAVAADTDDNGNLAVPPPALDANNNNVDVKLPSKSLSDTNLEIIGKAKFEDLAYVDLISNKLQTDLKHPHMGAQDEHGNWGYVFDETALRKNPPPFEFNKLERACANHDSHYAMLTKKVFVDLQAHHEKEVSGVKRDKIFCLVYTISPYHDAIPFIQQTWGPKCDGFMVASNLTDPTLGTVNIPHEGPEEYNNIWQKVRAMWSYVYDHYYEKYDWFHIGGDDLYLLVENLRLYLESEEIQLAQNGGIHLPKGDETEQLPLFLGRRFAYQGDRNDIFISGGSGYTMNKAALKLLVVKGIPKFMPHLKTFSEDTMVAKVLRKYGVEPYDTKDENGGERYMPFLPGHHLTYRLPKHPENDWYAKYSIDIKFGLDHCAARSVAFHYVKKDLQKRLHAILYHLCPGDDKAKEK